jgi:hypothetical protein
MKKNKEYNFPLTKSFSNFYKAKNINQHKYINYLNDHDTKILFAVGPTGTGKTLLACNTAIYQLKTQIINKIIITRPIIREENIENNMDSWSRNIFDIFSEYYSKNELDKMPIDERPIQCIKNEDEPWAHKNIHEGYGPIFWESIKSNTIANVGVIAGKHQSVKDLLMLNWLVSQAGDTRHFTDQSALNLIVNNILLKDKIEVNSDFAMQVDTLKSDKRFEKQQLSLKDGLVINTKDETPYVLVHQYDRIEQLNYLIENKYK